MKLKPLLAKVVIACLTVFSCVDPILVDGDNSEPKLVVDAYFTTDAQFNTVRLARSARFSNNYPNVPFNAPVTGAVVKVLNGAGSVVADYTETTPGLYQTDAIAEAGEEYYLEITLDNGAVYRSDFQRVADEVPINDLTFNITRETRIEESSGSFLELESYYFNVQVNTHDPHDEKNYFLWRSYGTFEYMTLPIGDAPCEYCDCWAPIAPLLPYVPVMSDAEVSGGLLSKKIASIKYDRATPFLTKVYQFSLMPDAFRFWNSMASQQTSVGTIFDPIPEPIQGNLVNIDNNSEIVLGFFTTAGVSQKHLLIDRGQEAQQLNITESNLIKPEVGDCRLLYKNATHIKPPEFNE